MSTVIGRLSTTYVRLPDLEGSSSSGNETDCPFAYSSARAWSSSTLTPNTFSPTDAYVERLRLSAFSCVPQGPQRLPQKLTTTTSPRCSDNRTLLPARACK